MAVHLRVCAVPSAKLLSLVVVLCASRWVLSCESSRSGIMSVNNLSRRLNKATWLYMCGKATADFALLVSLGHAHEAFCTFRCTIHDEDYALMQSSDFGVDPRLWCTIFVRDACMLAFPVSRAIWHLLFFANTAPPASLDGPWN